MPDHAYLHLSSELLQAPTATIHVMPGTARIVPGQHKHNPMTPRWQENAPRLHNPHNQNMMTCTRTSARFSYESQLPSQEVLARAFSRTAADLEPGEGVLKSVCVAHHLLQVLEAGAQPTGKLAGKLAGSWARPQHPFAPQERCWWRV